MSVKLEDLIANLGLEVDRDARGKWVIPAHLIETLREADRLAKEGAGTVTLRRVLGITVAPEAPADATSELEPASAAAPAEPAAEAGPGFADHELPGMVAAAVAGALKSENALAEKYARAAHRIGDLEATARGLEAERARLADELAAARAELTDARAELIAVRHERDHLRALRTAPAPRPWWKLWG